MPKLGSGEIQFHGCMLKPAVAISVCFHSPQCVPDRDRILAHLVKTGVDLEGDFSLTLDADGKEDVLMVFGNPRTLNEFKTLVDTLVVTDEGGNLVMRDATVEEKEALIEQLAKCDPEQWKALMRFCVRELESEQELLAEIVCSEAQRRAKQASHGEAKHAAADHLASVLSDIGLELIVPR